MQRAIVFFAVVAQSIAAAQVPSDIIAYFGSITKNVDPYQFACDHYVTPQDMVKKIYCKRASARDITQYIMYRLMYRLQSRWHYCDRGITRRYFAAIGYAIKQRCMSNKKSVSMYDNIFQALLPGGVHIVSLGGVSGSFDITDQHIDLDSKSIYEDPFYTLFTIEHEITHMEQLYNRPPIYNKYRNVSELSPIDAQFASPHYTSLSAYMVPCEYDADYQATEHIPLPYALALRFQLPGGQRGGVDAHYSSKSRLRHWLCKRSRECFSDEALEDQRFLFEQYGCSPCGVAQLASSISVMGGLSYVTVMRAPTVYALPPVASICAGIALSYIHTPPHWLQRVWQWHVNNAEGITVQSASYVFDTVEQLYSYVTHVYQISYDNMHGAVRRLCTPDASRSISELVRESAIDISRPDPYTMPKRILPRSQLNRIARTKKEAFQDYARAKQHVFEVACTQGVIEIIPDEQEE